MPANGKSNGHATAPETTDVAAERYNTPLDPTGEITYVKTGRGWKYYLSLKGNWQKWWDEFATALEDSGKLKYPTVWRFIREKAKTETDRNYLLGMIGPRPILEEGEKAEVPWLGDWQERRKQGFWAFDNARKVQDLERVYRDNVQKLEAARSLAPTIAKHMRRFESFSDKIDEAFGGQPFIPTEAPNSPRNKQRVRHYLRLHKAALQVSITLWGQWFRAHGLDPNDPTAWLTLRLADGQSIVPPNLLGDGRTIEGELVQPVSLPDGVTVDDLMMAKAMRAKANRFKMGMPAGLDALVPDTTPEDMEKAKANGKKVH